MTNIGHITVKVGNISLARTQSRHVCISLHTHTHTHTQRERERERERDRQTDTDTHLFRCRSLEILNYSRVSLKESFLLVKSP